jgi:hypothetical protein
MLSITNYKHFSAILSRGSQEFVRKGKRLINIISHLPVFPRPDDRYSSLSIRNTVADPEVSKK